MDTVRGAAGNRTDVAFDIANVASSTLLPGRMPSWIAKIRIAYKASDDYGVTKVQARVVPVLNPNATPLMVELAPPGNAKQLTTAVTRDLTSNPYAGTEVNITLIATDAAVRRSSRCRSPAPGDRR